MSDSIEVCKKKRRYPDSISAELMRSKMLMLNTKIRQKAKWESRAYECQWCKGWHLTSTPMRVKVK